MNGKPDLLVIFDVLKDKLAVLEAKIKYSYSWNCR